MKYTFIESETQLQHTCSTLEKEKNIGVDLEADSMHCFKEKICLIQIATDREAYLIDPFVVKDISAFVRILENKKITKIFHGADFDIRSLDRDYHARVNNLFDTEIACRFLGVKERGLGALLKDHFNVNANKKFQKVDWSQRPLKKDMIEYSVGDVAYLTKLHEILTGQLLKKGRLSWAKEEFEFQEQVRYENNHKRPLFKKFKGAGRLNNRSLAVLENLLELRLNLAEQKDRPLFKIISNKALLTLANEMPGTVEEMLKIRAMGPRQARMYGNLCLKSILNAVNLPHKDLPSYPKTKRPKKDATVIARVKKLKKKREFLCVAFNMEPGVLLNNTLITSISVHCPETIEELTGIEGIRKWQVEIMGQEILSCLGNAKVKT